MPNKSTNAQSRRPLKKGEEEVMVIREPGVIGFDRYTPGPIPPWEVRGKTLFSGISAGTEMTIYRGSNPYAHKRFDPALKLFLPETGEQHFYPAVVGYEEVGVVTTVGADVRGVQVGDRVWGSWGASHRICAAWRCGARQHFASRHRPALRHFRAHRRHRPQRDFGRPNQRRRDGGGVWRGHGRADLYGLSAFVGCAGGGR